MMTRSYMVVWKNSRFSYTQPTIAYLNDLSDKDFLKDVLVNAHAARLTKLEGVALPFTNCNPRSHYHPHCREQTW